MSMLALTSYYNPLQGPLRRLNYRTFRRHLGIPLMTVEWSRDGHFDLEKGDAEHLIQVSGGDLLWQKERLLNIGLSRAQSIGFHKVAVLDSDIVFKNHDWHKDVSQQLERDEFIQCFQTAHYLPPGEHQHLSREALCQIPTEHSAPSLFSRITQGKDIFQSGATDFFYPMGSNQIMGNPGLATAINLERVPNWKSYEGNIVGGGDLAMLSVLTDKTDLLFSLIDYTLQHQQHLNDWGQYVGKPRVKIGNIQGDIYHLWHGEMKNRQYRQRYSILTQCHYDPYKDIDFDTSGALRFAHTSGHLREAIENYIHSRQDA